MMSKRKKTLPICSNCGSNDKLYVTLGNGEKLPSFVIKIGQGIWCNECNALSKVGA